MGLLLLLYFICRVIFYWFNRAHFEGVELLTAFIGGIRFDLSAIAILNVPLVILSLIPFQFIQSRGYQKFLLSLYAVVNLPALLMNLVDTEYFKFTSKRSTADFFDLFFLGDDMLTLLPSYLRDYWYITLLFAFAVWFFVRRIRKMPFAGIAIHPMQIGWQTFALVIGLGVFIFAYRGGVQLKPINNLNAVAYGRPQDVPLILNTPFSIIRTFGKNALSKKTYFEKKELEALYNPVHSVQSDVMKKDNVVIIILESFSEEFVGEKNDNGLAYTPFLDSLMSVGDPIQHAYANGCKSMEALPAIIAGIPSLMDDPFITSIYTGSAVDGLPRYLSSFGYQSAFFHGGKTGTMAFDRFATSAGFDRYVGLEDFPDQSQYDGTWGIYDGPFFDYTAKEINKMEEPYFATLFSLSSHHPYAIPKYQQSTHSEFETGLERTINYADDCLRSMFTVLKQSPNFDRTLFVITADHTPNSHSKEFLTPLGNYSVPILFYKPTDSIELTCAVGQHIDIQPTIIEYLGLKGDFVGFGKSCFSSDESWSIQYLSGFYQFRFENYFLIFDGTKTIEIADLENFKAEVPEHVKTAMETKLKAIIQSYHERMIDNQLTAYD